MKKNTKLIIASLIALSTLITTIPVVKATVFGYKRATGVFNVYYDYTVAQKGYTTQFDWARSKWSAASSKVSIGKTTTATTSTDQYYIGYHPIEHHYGETFYYGGKQDPNLSDWDYSMVYIFDNNMVKDDMKNDTNMKSVALHEVGHSLGLAHTNEVNSTLRSQSVMTSGEDPFVNFNITAPSDYDKGELRYKWGN